MNKVPEAEKHCYKNYMHVISILTLQYGFEYTGIGPNREECFHKESTTCSEAIFIHPMSCSYMMDPPGLFGWKNRLHSVSFNSGFDNHKEQEIAFKELCLYLDKFSIKEESVLTKEHLESKFMLLEEMRLNLVKLATDREVSVDHKKLIPTIYGYLIHCQSTVSFVLSKLK